MPNGLPCAVGTGEPHVAVGAEGGTFRHGAGGRDRVLGDREGSERGHGGQHEAGTRRDHDHQPDEMPVTGH